MEPYKEYNHPNYKPQFLAVYFIYWKFTHVRSAKLKCRHQINQGNNHSMPLLTKNTEQSCYFFMRVDKQVRRHPFINEKYNFLSSLTIYAVKTNILQCLTSVQVSKIKQLLTGILNMRCNSHIITNCPALNLIAISTSKLYTWKWRGDKLTNQEDRKSVV